MTFEHVWRFLMGFLVGFCCHSLLRRFHPSARACKGLVLALLTRHGVLTGRQLKDLSKGQLGGSLYSLLYELEKEGLIESQEIAKDHPEPAGQLPRRHYRLKGSR